MDLLAMALKDAEIPPKDDYSNIEKAIKMKIISKTHGDLLREANGLRNRLIHTYNDINDQIALKSLYGMLERLESFLEDLKKWIKTN